MLSRKGLLSLLLPLLLSAQTAPWPTYGWTTATPESQGLDSAQLEQAAQFVAANCPTRYSLLVVRNGYLVLERYYNGSHAAQFNNIKSMSKSVLSVLTGVAIQEERIRGVDQKLHEFYPEYFHAGLDPRKFDVTLEHLLTMTAGFEWLENSPASARCWMSSDWHGFVIDSPLTSNPGEVFNYSTGLTHLLSGILTRASGMNTLDYATSRLFGPLGMTCYQWSRDPRGYYFGGSEVWLTARDLAKFGLLCLRKGRWEDHTVVPESWIADSTRLRIRTNASLGDYAYLWWKYTINGYPVTLASGYGGQNIFLVPDIDLMMVTTARSDIPNQPGSVYSQPYEILSTYLLPAVIADPPAIAAGGVVNAADYTDRLAPGAFLAVFGSGFSTVATTWDSAMPADGWLPPGVGGVRVQVGGRTAFPSYVSPGQVNVLLPPDLPAGRHELRIDTPKGRATQEIEVTELAPAWFVFWHEGRPYATPNPVRPGEAIAVWASGLGPTDPPTPAGSVLDRPLPTVHTPEVLIAGQPAQVLYSGLVYAGVYQVNIKVPDDVPPGEVPLRLRVADTTSPIDATLQIAP